MAHATAALQFTEVMYDTPGADTGREWLEVTNGSVASVDIGGDKLFESGVNHAVTVVQGTTTLAAGESAIIAANPAKFLADYPNYTGTLFKSSFSLTNAGEAVELRDKTLATLASLAYSSALGAAGDGNSLHLSGAALAPGAPNPGSSAPTSAIVNLPAQAGAAPASASKAVKTSSAKTAATKTSNNTNTPSADSAYQGKGAAVGMAPMLQNIPSIYLYIVGLLAVIVLGVGAVMYAKPLRTSLVETKSTSEEFELE